MAEGSPFDANIFEKLGTFFLGKKAAVGEEIADEAVLYDAKDLTTHAVCVGMTGSGKTGLCVGLLEEAFIDSIPALIIDPKGDLTNLLLTFPELRPEDFQPWVDPGEAGRKGIDIPTLARNTAELWKSGLAKWGQSGDRIRKLKDSVDFTIYTPGSSAGVGLSILKSFTAPSDAVIEDSDLLRDRLQATVSGLLSLAGIKSDSIQSKEHILISNIIESSWHEGQDIDLASLIMQIQKPPFDKLGVFDLETFYPASDRMSLAISLNNLLASPGFESWMNGEPLDIQRLLWTEEGKPRCSILYIAHLSESERMFFVTLLLNEVISWMRKQSGTSSLRALLYMDEVFGYFPPTANPPSKKPMLTLLKQARAFGLGVVLSTQNPVDLDYKGLSNAGTWFIGRLQTERDKARVLDGLEGASAAAGAKFDRKTMETTISGLEKRMFLLNNVHEDAPELFKTRWVLSYLRGPMTRDHVKTLMQEKKWELTASAEKTDKARPKAVHSTKPVIPTEVEERYSPVVSDANDDGKLVYVPTLFSSCKLHYARTSAGIDYWKELSIQTELPEEIPVDIWENAKITEANFDEFEEEGIDDASFAEVPGDLGQKKSYKGWQKDLKNHLYSQMHLTIYKCTELKMYSNAEETKGDFLVRLRDAAREARDVAVEKLRDKYESKFRSIESKMRTAEERIAREKSQYSQQKLQTVISAGSSILGSLFSGRKRSSGWTTVARGVGRAAREKGDVNRAKRQLKVLEADFKELERQLDDDVNALKNQYDVEAFVLEEIKLAPKKSDIAMTDLAVVWETR